MRGTGIFGEGGQEYLVRGTGIFGEGGKEYLVRGGGGGNAN